MPENTADLRNVVEGDTVTIETTEGARFLAECVFYEKQHADPRSGLVRETNLWQFEGDRNVAVSFTDGLKSSPDDPEFPVHNEMWDCDLHRGEGHECSASERGSTNSDEEESIGYIESLTIAGAKV